MGLFLHSRSTSELIPLLHGLIPLRPPAFTQSRESTWVSDPRLHQCDLFSHYHYLTLLVLIDTWFM